MTPTPRDKFFSLDLQFDWHREGELQYSVSERCLGLNQPASWQPVKQDGPDKNLLGKYDDNCYLVVMVWGNNVDPSTDRIHNLCLGFDKSEDCPKQAATSPFDKDLTSALQKGVQLDSKDIVLHLGSSALWVLNPVTQVPELPSAGFKKHIGAELWFHYFPRMIPGHYNFDVELAVTRSYAEKRFHLDPEMEVGDDDDGEGNVPVEA